MLKNSVPHGSKVTVVKFSLLPHVKKQRKGYILPYQGTRIEADNVVMVANVPSAFTIKDLEYNFSSLGKIRSCYFIQSLKAHVPISSASEFFPMRLRQPHSRIAVVIFDDADCAEQALNWPSKHILKLMDQNRPLFSGIHKWLKEHRDQVHSMESIESEVKSYMMKFDEEIAMKEEIENKEGAEDSDGWEIVGKKTGFNRTEEKQKQLSEKGKLKSSSHQQARFYSFQITDSKRNHVTNLRRKFEEDKQRIALMKATQKFKPF